MNSHSYADLALVATRLIGFAVAIWALHVMVPVAVARWKKSQGIIPKPIIVFTLAWLITLLVTQGIVLFTIDGPVEYPILRSLYYMSFSWSIFGLAWVVRCGAEHQKVVNEVIASKAAVDAARTLLENEVNGNEGDDVAK